MGRLESNSGPESAILRRKRIRATLAARARSVSPSAEEIVIAIVCSFVSSFLLPCL